MAVDEALIGSPLRVGSQLGKPTQPEASCYDSTRSATPTGSDRGSLSPMKVPQTLTGLALDVDRDMQSLWMRLHTVQQERALTQAGHQLRRTPREGGEAHKVLFAEDEPAWISWDQPLLSTAPRPPVPPPPVPPPPVPCVPVDRDSWGRRKQALEAQPLSEPKWCTPPKQKEVLISLGSVGHPYTCGAACKYVRRKSGCRDGSDCSSCHLCVWNRKATREEVGQVERAAAPMRVDLAPPAPAVAPAHTAPPQAHAAGQHEGAADGTTASLGPCMRALVAEEEAPSLGSIGHPYLCAKACKYNAKHRGCKDGRCCVRCHLCMWRRCLQ